MTRYRWHYVLIIFQVTLGIIYLSAGLSKLIPGFPNIIGPVWLIDELSKYGLKLFGYFVAIMQAAVGGLLLISRFRLIAALMLLPMHMCILIVPISLGWQGTPYVNAALLGMLLSLLYDDRQRLYGLITTKPVLPDARSKTAYWSTFVLIWTIALLLRYP